MQLLEREEALSRLKGLVALAAEGTGHVALVRGEAGIGKTSLIDQFVADVEDAHLLWGACDDLVAARPLGPVWDMAFDEPSIESALNADDRTEVFHSVLDLFANSLRPTVMVIEDVHWADVATLDLIKYLGRRISQSHGLLILTYRDGEVVGDHPLRIALGDLPYGVVERIALEPLSVASVAVLAGERADAQAVWDMTGGNPFFVSEALDASGDSVPVSIADAVNARLMRLSKEARALVELVSVSPTRVPLSMVQSIAGSSEGSIAEAEAAGLLELSGTDLKFRHELARRAVEGELAEITRRSLNLSYLRVGESLNVDISRLGHHALAAGDSDAIIRLLPEAARRASQLESHQEAVANLRALEPYLEHMTPEQLADHYDLWAYEEYLWDQANTELIEEAIALRRELGDRAALGRSLLSASRIAWVKGDRSAAVAYAEEAISVLEEVGGEDLAMAYSTLSQLAMLANDAPRTIAYAEKALAIVGDKATRARSHALNNFGSVLMSNRYPDGIDELEESREIARKVGLAHDEARACVNLAWGHLWHRNLDEAEVWIDRSQEIMTEAEMPTFESYAVTMRALLELHRGNWDEADDLARDVLGRSAILGTSRATTTTVVAKLAVRRGAPDASALVERSIELAVATQELQRTGPAAEVASEYAWLGGDVSRETLEWCVDQMNLATQLGGDWNALELAQFLTALGMVGDIPDSIPEPGRLLVDGRWREAADWWADRGIPYDHAVSLSFGDTEAKLQALRILDDLGAIPLANRLRAELQDAGVKGVPRGPQRATRENPLGLTPRQTEVLELLTENLTNAEIADRLFVSTRTVDHHVSAILAKLGAENRADAAEMARQLAG